MGRDSEPSEPNIGLGWSSPRQQEKKKKDKPAPQPPKKMKPKKKFNDDTVERIDSIW